MTFIELISISIALGLDASGVCLSLGLDRRVNKNIAIYIIGAFALFQFFLALVGGFLGCLFHKYIYDLPNIYGGIILLVLGIIMALEGFSKNEKKIKIKWYMIFILAISVSIDALIVGFSVFSDIYSNYILLQDSLFVGLITAFLCTGAFFVSKHVRKVDFVKEYADFIGGAVLVILGIRMIFG